MSELTDRLRAYGADMDGAMERFVGDEELFGECFSMFLEDAAFAALEDSLKKQDYRAAFEAAHTLKGVAGNLGLTPLYQAICQLVEPLRRGEYSALQSQYEAVADARSAVEKLK